jgi:hypothetical protein
MNQLRDLEEVLSEARFSHPLLFDEKAEDLTVLRVNALTVFGYVTAEHFPVSIRDFHGFSFLKRGHVLTDSPPRTENLPFSPLKGAVGSVTS